MRQSNVKCKSSTVTSTIHVSKAVTTIYQATHINTRQGCLRCRCLSCVTAPKPRSHFVDPYPLSVFLGLLRISEFSLAETERFVDTEN
uniref:Uncharacterized protein n=1 Tax=Brassica oleracea var. oleracea TaxID=109376 RepID=A0A0D3BLN4_BRAOL